MNRIIWHELAFFLFAAIFTAYILASKNNDSVQEIGAVNGVGGLFILGYMNHLLRKMKA